MSNKYKPRVDMKSIKEYEKSLRQDLSPLAEPKEPDLKRISFDEWWLNTLANTRLHPSAKEILKADAKGRGLDGLQAADKWDWAAKQFGLNI
jgi:hypothetical protein